MSRMDKRLRPNSANTGCQSSSRSKMMSYCIIRSKLKRAKQDQLQGAHQSQAAPLAPLNNNSSANQRRQQAGGRRQQVSCDHLPPEITCRLGSSRRQAAQESEHRMSHDKPTGPRSVDADKSPEVNRLADHEELAANLCGRLKSEILQLSPKLGGSENLQLESQSKNGQLMEDEAAVILSRKPPTSSHCQPQSARPKNLPASGQRDTSKSLRHSCSKANPSFASSRCLLLASLLLLCLALIDWRPVRFGGPKMGSGSLFSYLASPRTAREYLGGAGMGIMFAEAQYRPEWPSKLLQQEIFLLNLEDGYFGCQVNESQDYLQLFELSKLCDGQTQCYLGTDEMVGPLKCNNRERCGLTTNARGEKETHHCVNGVCLDGLCYCNDGFGGKSCDVPDENECKFRPCDVFAHCTNTMGSYYCSCFPGYDGDGMHCQDINECEIPSLAALCSDNSECCNLPGHFVCKCKPGYQQSGQSQSSLSGAKFSPPVDINGAPSGNSSVQCTDIDECLDEHVCGRGAVCENLPGSFRCTCPPGFIGDPSVECIDMDECRNNPCGLGAQCTNIPGGYRCSCPQGFERNPALPANMFGTIQSSASVADYTNSSLVACLDVNECAASSPPACGPDAQCINTQGAYFCQCPPNFTGNPKVGCQDIDECEANACGPNTICKNSPGAYQCECKQGFTGNAYSADGCQDEDECLRKDACGLNAQCFNTPGSHECSCLSGFTGNPRLKCTDIDECSAGNGQGGPCGPGAQCINTPGGYKCTCPDKYLARGSPEMGCERAAVDIGCSADFDCTKNALCVNSTCQCKMGFQINGIECVDLDECSMAPPPQPPAKPFTKLSAAIQQQQLANGSLSSALSLCGSEAQCVNTEGSYSCKCRAGYEKIDPLSPKSKCRDIDECEQLGQPCGQNSRCFNTDGSYKCACTDGFIQIDQDPANGCKSPCDGVNCGQHATCKPHGEEAACVCKPGFTFDPNNIKLGCVDINECDTNYGPSGLCGQRAICTNIPGSYRCSCPAGYSGDPERYCEDINECDRKFGVFGQCGELAVCNNTQGGYSCTCAPGFQGDPKVKCQDVDECDRRFGPNGKCGANAICSNLPGKFQCRCPPNHSGDPYVGCQPELPSCSSQLDCSTNQVCRSGRCQCPFSQQPADTPPGECHHPCERTECGPHASCQLDDKAEPLCVCEAGYMAPGDGRSGCVDVNECIQGLTLSGVTPISALTSGQGGVALGPSALTTLSPLTAAGGSGQQGSGNGSHPCGRNALCRNHPGSFDCVCPPGHSGNPYEACTLEVRNQLGQKQDQQQQQLATQKEGEPFGNYQQEPRTTACSEPCPRGLVCLDGGCVKPNSCRDNYDCRSTMACEQVNQLAGFQCVNVCEVHQCGPRAKCTPINHKPICACNASAGYSGDPYDPINGCRLDSQQQSSFPDIHRTTIASSGQLDTYDATTRSQANGTVDDRSNKWYTQTTQESSHPTTTPQVPQYQNAPYNQAMGSMVSANQTVKYPAATNQQLVQQNTSYPQQTTKQQQQQQVYPTKRRPGQQQQQQGQQSDRLDAMAAYGEQRRPSQSLADHLSPLKGQPGSDEQPSNNPFANKSSPILVTGYLFSYKQVDCTNDQHCPGNLFCLRPEAMAPGQLSGPQSSGSSKDSQMLCGCPMGYRREADYCFMQRVNCSSSAVCKSREECIPATTLQQYYASSSTFQQSHLITGGQQQFSFPDEFSGICVCPRGYRLTSSGVACIDRNECDEGTPCALGAICQNKIGSYECVCPPGTTGDPYTKTCEPINKNKQQQQQQLQQGQSHLDHQCQANADCPSDKECDLSARRCVSPCYVCGPRAVCTAANHQAICLCPPRYTGSAIDLVYGCQEPANPTTTTQLPATNQPPTTTTTRPGSSFLAPNQTGSTAVGVPVTTLLPSMTTTLAPASALESSTTSESVEFRTIPPSELFVMCLADGIQVEVQLGGFDGIIYVKGHSQDPKCRKLVMSSSASEFVDFKVQFGHCDLIHRDGEAGFVLVIQKHPKLVTYRARAYHVKCVYNTGERTVTLGFNVSMITTSGTIANTGPPPTCLMSITSLEGREVTSAEIGQDLLLRVDVQPDSIYGGFARSCEAKTMDDEGEYQYEVTDANGCATDPSIFSDWKYDQDRKSLVARFNAFKFPSSNNLRFQCNIRVCFGSCPAVNCNGVDAFGRRRRRRDAPAIDGPSSDFSGASFRLSNSSRASDDSDLDTPADEMIVSDTFKEGALREEVMVQSNAILTFDKKEPSLPQQRSSQVEDIEFVCLPRLGIVMSALLTVLLALLALAIGTSCWCFAKRKRHARSHSNGPSGGPLPHPMDFPNPLLRSSSVSTLREQLYGP